MSLKVLHVLDVLRPSGAETCLRVAGSMWGAESISCDVLATGDELGPYAVQLREAGYRTGHLPLDDMRRFLRSFPRLVRSEGYDVVHIHVERANFHIALLAMWAGAKVVQHVHNVFDFEGALRLERTVQRRIVSALGVPFLGVSQDVVDNERTRYGIEAEVFLNWADIDRYRPPSDRQRAAARQALGLDEDVFVLASVANCHDFKNHESWCGRWRACPATWSGCTLARAACSRRSRSSPSRWAYRIGSSSSANAIRCRRSMPPTRS